MEIDTYMKKRKCVSPNSNKLKSLDNEDSDNVKIERKIGIFGSVSFIVGAIIGSGIFISPKGVTEASGSIGFTLINWTLCGIIAVMGALCYAELGTVVPESGGEHVYLMKSFGNLPSYLFSWASLMVTYPAAFSVVSLTCAEYILVPLYDDGCGKPPDSHLKIAAIMIMLLILAINIYSVNLAARIQIIFTVAKVLALGVIIMGGIVNLFQGRTKHLASGFQGTETKIGKIVLSYYNGMWAYGGWNNLNFITEEVKDPARNLPLSICIALPLVVLVYVLTNISYFTVMSAGELVASPAVAVTWAESVIPTVVWIIPLSIAMSTFGATNGHLFACSRLSYAATKEGHMPYVFGMIQLNAHTPIPALMFMVVMVIIYTALGNVATLMNYVSFVYWIFFAMSMGALLYLRVKNPNAPRPVKMFCFSSAGGLPCKNNKSSMTSFFSGHLKVFEEYLNTNKEVPLVIPVIMIAVCVFLVIVPIATDPRWEFVLAIVVLFVGLVFYIPFVHFRLTFPGMNAVTTFIQLASQCLLPDTIQYQRHQTMKQGQHKISPPRQYKEETDSKAHSVSTIKTYM